MKMNMVIYEYGIKKNKHGLIVLQVFAGLFYKLVFILKPR